MMIAMSSVVVYAAEEKEWQWYTKCVDMRRMDKVVIETRTLKQYSISVSDRFNRRTQTGNWLYYFTMGADVWCTMMHRKDYENSR